MRSDACRLPHPATPYQRRQSCELGVKRRMQSTRATEWAKNGAQRCVQRVRDQGSCVLLGVIVRGIGGGTTEKRQPRVRRDSRSTCSSRRNFRAFAVTPRVTLHDPSRPLAWRRRVLVSTSSRASTGDSHAVVAHAKSGKWFERMRPPSVFQKLRALVPPFAARRRSVTTSTGACSTTRQPSFAHRPALRVRRWLSSTSSGAAQSCRASAGRARIRAVIRAGNYTLEQYLRVALRSRTRRAVMVLLNQGYR